MHNQAPHLAAAAIVEDAGGELVGRTRLQKVAYLMHLAGYGDTFSFEYRHYGPYSEELAQAMEIATILGPVNESERTAGWGGRYSIYSVECASPETDKTRFVRAAKDFDAVELELAATAAYLYEAEGIGRVKKGNPWQETSRRKPTKAKEGRLHRAAAAYKELRKLPTDRELPDLSQFDVCC